MAKIDVVYVLGTGTKWRNNEIRFSLRSLQKNLQEFGKVWIVGEKPSFIQNVNHIPFPDELINNNDGNIIRKVLRVCQEKSLTARFLFINDDHLVMQPIMAEEVPPYHKGDMLTFPKSYFEESAWRLRLWRTRNILAEKGFTSLHFDCHTPMVMDKKKFPKAMVMFDFEKTTGYTMKSLYGNVYHQDAPLMQGEKVTLFRPYTLKDIIERTSGRHFVSFNDTGMTPMLKQWLYQAFPEASDFESDSSDPSFQMIDWLTSDPRDYEAGRILYEKYGKSKKAQKYFGRDESDTRMQKMEHKIRELLNDL